MFIVICYEILPSDIIKFLSYAVKTRGVVGSSAPQLVQLFFSHIFIRFCYYNVHFAKNGTRDHRMTTSLMDPLYSRACHISTHRLLSGYDRQTKKTITTTSPTEETGIGIKTSKNILKKNYIMTTIIIIMTYSRKDLYVITAMTGH